MQKVLVLGATGFLGSHILDALTQYPGIQVIAGCRTPPKLPSAFKGEVRQGDLTDPAYRASVVQGVDVICNAGGYSSMWGHRQREQHEFFLPTRDLIDHSIAHGVSRYIQTSTFVVADRATRAVRDDAPPAKTGFWPHLDMLIDLEHYMQTVASPANQMITMRLGHFVGAGNTLGLVPALAPRLRTHLVPWIANGRNRLPLVSGIDMGIAYARAVISGGLDDYESFNIAGTDYPTMREVLTFIAAETGLPLPHYSVPASAAYLFGALMELLNPLLPGSSPFLTRAIVHVGENWEPSIAYATEKLGYVPRIDWRIAIREQLDEIVAANYPWPRLATS